MAPGAKPWLIMRFVGASARLLLRGIAGGSTYPLPNLDPPCLVMIESNIPALMCVGKPGTFFLNCTKADFVRGKGVAVAIGATQGQDRSKKEAGTYEAIHLPCATGESPKYLSCPMSISSARSILAPPPQCQDEEETETEAQ